MKLKTCGVEIHVRPIVGNKCSGGYSGELIHNCCLTTTALRGHAVSNS